MTTPTTSRVSDAMLAAACDEYDSVLSISDEAQPHAMRAAIEAALASLGDVVAVSALEDLIKLHCGMMAKEENYDIISGAATVIADLEDLISRAKS